MDDSLGAYNALKMARGNRANLDRLLQSASEVQQRLESGTVPITKRQDSPRWKTPLRWTLVGIFGGGAIGVPISHADFRLFPLLVTLALLFLFPEVIRKAKRRRLVSILTFFICVLVEGAISVWPIASRPIAITTPTTVLSIPDLSWVEGTEGSFMSTFDPQKSDGVLIVYAGILQNRSSTPTTVHNWKLEVTLPGESTVRFGDLLRPAGQRLSVWNTVLLNQMLKEGFSWNNYLPEMTAKTPIRFGVPAVGWVGFVLKNVPNARLKKGTILHLTCDDELGQPHFAQKTLAEPLPQMPYIPGLLPATH